MQFAIFCAAAALLSLIIWKIVNHMKSNRNHTNKRPTGCATSLSCQYMDLGKASKAGKAKDVTFCKRSNSFVKRHDQCPDFYPHGCANGICDHSDHSNNQIYCKYYQKNVQPKETCSNYLDFFDTEAGKSLAESLK